MVQPLIFRIKRHIKKMKESIRQEKFIYELMDVLRETPLWKEIGEDNLWLDDMYGWWYSLTIKSKIDVQRVEDEFCRAIRQKYNVTWDMEVDASGVTLKTQFQYPLPNFNIEIKSPDFNGCEIVKIPIKILTEEELEAKRIEYEYLIKCNE